MLSCVVASFNKLIASNSLPTPEIFGKTVPKPSPSLKPLPKQATQKDSASPPNSPLLSPLFTPLDGGDSKPSSPAVTKLKAVEKSTMDVPQSDSSSCPPPPPRYPPPVDANPMYPLAVGRSSYHPGEPVRTMGAQASRSLPSLPVSSPTAPGVANGTNPVPKQPALPSYTFAMTANRSPWPTGTTSGSSSAQIDFSQTPRTQSLPSVAQQRTPSDTVVSPPFPALALGVSIPQQAVFSTGNAAASHSAFSMANQPLVTRIAAGGIPIQQHVKRRRLPPDIHTSAAANIAAATVAAAHAAAAQRQRFPPPPAAPNAASVAVAATHHPLPPFKGILIPPLPSVDTTAAAGQHRKMLPSTSTAMVAAAALPKMTAAAPTTVPPPPKTIPLVSKDGTDLATILPGGPGQQATVR